MFVCVVCVFVYASHCVTNFLIFQLNLTTWSEGSSVNACVYARVCMNACMHTHMHIPIVRMIKLRFNEWGDPLWGDTPCPRSKEKPQQDGRRGKFMSQTPLLPETLRGLKQTLCTPGPRDPAETENCVWASPVEVRGSRLGYGISPLGGHR